MIEVRPAKKTDTSQLSVLMRQQIELQQGYDRLLQLVSNVDWDEYVSAKLDAPASTILVAEKDGNLVGYIDIRIAQQGVLAATSRFKAIARVVLRFWRRYPTLILQPRRYGFIDDVYVADSLRNRPVGVGVRLIKSSFDWFEQQQVSHIEGACAMQNQLIQSLLPKFGFEPISVLVRKRL